MLALCAAPKRKHWWRVSLRPSLTGRTSGLVRAGDDFEIVLNFASSDLHMPSVHLPSEARWDSEGFTGVLLTYRQLRNQSAPSAYLHSLWSTILEAGQRYLATTSSTNAPCRLGTGFENEVGRFLRDHDGGCVGVSANNTRHDRCVDHSQVLHTVHA